MSEISNKSHVLNKWSGIGQEKKLQDCKKTYVDGNPTNEKNKFQEGIYL